MAANYLYAVIGAFGLLRPHCCSVDWLLKEAPDWSLVADSRGGAWGAVLEPQAAQSHCCFELFLSNVLSTVDTLRPIPSTGRPDCLTAKAVRPRILGIRIVDQSYRPDKTKRTRPLAGPRAAPDR